MNGATAVRAGPAPRTAVRRVGVPAAVAAVLVAVALLVALVGTGSRGGDLDPRSATPAGTRALAVLLEGRGVDVRRVSDAEGAGGGGTTVVVPFPGRLTPEELRRLSERAPAGGDVVLVAPDGAALDAIGRPASTAGTAPVARRAPSCGLAEATTADEADLGGRTYAAPDAPDAQRCYPADGHASLLVLPRGDGRLVLLGTGEPFTNGRLGDEGNAALALGLLGRHPGAVWVAPPAGRAAAVGARRRAVDLLPAGVVAGLVQLAVGVVVLALWRARRLGPPVAEPLPVVVRAAEAVEGRARL
ncbi:MAG TPA: DUF4350 domain-containing protein, partial [Frankiaceae bacterium]|nr:DUF4350 domain-containing protein [Frankiaceae bacterium]